jgi:hypothetical protein
MAIGPIGGVAFVKLNGLQYELRGDLEVQPNTTENEWMANQDGTMVYTQKAVPPFISGKFSDTGGLSLQQMNAAAGITITAELINGKVYTLQQGAAWGEFKLTAASGEVTGKFGGVACYEVLA